MSKESKFFQTISDTLEKVCYTEDDLTTIFGEFVNLFIKSNEIETKENKNNVLEFMEGNTEKIKNK